MTMIYYTWSILLALGMVAFIRGRNSRIYMQYYKNILVKKFNESPYKAAAEKIGFIFGSLNVTVNPAEKQIFATYGFQCLCGKHERASFLIPFEEMKSITFIPDLAAELYNDGQFGYRHLIEDGYSHDEATRISRQIDEELVKHKWPAYQSAFTMQRA